MNSTIACYLAASVIVSNIHYIAILLAYTPSGSIKKNYIFIFMQEVFSCVCDFLFFYTIFPSMFVLSLKHKLQFQKFLFLRFFECCVAVILFLYSILLFFWSSFITIGAYGNTIVKNCKSFPNVYQHVLLTCGSLIIFS